MCKTVDMDTVFTSSENNTNECTKKAFVTTKW